QLEARGELALVHRHERARTRRLRRRNAVGGGDTIEIVTRHPIAEEAAVEIEQFGIHVVLTRSDRGEGRQLAFRPVNVETFRAVLERRIAEERDIGDSVCAEPRLIFGLGRRLAESVELGTTLLPALR